MYLPRSVSRLYLAARLPGVRRLLSSPDLGTSKIGLNSANQNCVCKQPTVVPVQTSDAALQIEGYVLATRCTKSPHPDTRDLTLILGKLDLCGQCPLGIDDHGAVSSRAAWSLQQHDVRLTPREPRQRCTVGDFLGCFTFLKLFLYGDFFHTGWPSSQSRGCVPTTMVAGASSCASYI